MARAPQWTPVVAEALDFDTSNPSGTLVLASVPAAGTVLRVLYALSMWRQEYPGSPVLATDVQVPVAVGVYYSGDLIDPAATPLPWTDRAAGSTLWATRTRWMWWEQLAWEHTGGQWYAPRPGSGRRDVEANRGSGGSDAAEVRLCWEVDQGSPQLYNPALAVSGRALLLTQE